MINVNAISAFREDLCGRVVLATLKMVDVRKSRQLLARRRAENDNDIPVIILNVHIPVLRRDIDASICHLRGRLVDA
jgi:hypothetical protein